jgi:hypothetical protein
MPTAKRKKGLPLPDRVPVRKGPVWEGPDGAGPNGGVTYSLLCRFLTCPERFRLLVVDGLRPAERFVAPLEYGSMWHVCEEYHASGPAEAWEYELERYAQGLMQKYPMQRPEVADWYEKCRALFPVYVEYWSQHDDVRNRTPLLSEQSFDVPYRLPSGRTVRLRGKWDSVDARDKVRPALVNQENKTKSGIDRTAITRQLTFDLQTMIYVVALDTLRHTPPTYAPENQWWAPVWHRRLLPLEVRYNVVRRSAHKGGRGVSAAESMLKKYREDAAEGREGEWFARWNVEVSPADVARFRARCLDPLLERLCNWWRWITVARKGEDPFSAGYYGDDTPVALHYQHPFGVRNILDEGGATDLDECVLTGSTVGLNRTTNLFPELT